MEPVAPPTHIKRLPPPGAPDFLSSTYAALRDTVQPQLDTDLFASIAAAAVANSNIIVDVASGEVDERVRNVAEITSGLLGLHSHHVPLSSRTSGTQFLTALFVPPTSNRAPSPSSTRPSSLNSCRHSARLGQPPLDPPAEARPRPSPLRQSIPLPQSSVSTTETDPTTTTTALDPFSPTSPDAAQPLLGRTRLTESPSSLSGSDSNSDADGIELQPLRSAPPQLEQPYTARTRWAPGRARPVSACHEQTASEAASTRAVMEQMSLFPSDDGPALDPDDVGEWAKVPYLPQALIVSGLGRAKRSVLQALLEILRSRRVVIEEEEEEEALVGLRPKRWAAAAAADNEVKSGVWNLPRRFMLVWVREKNEPDVLRSLIDYFALALSLPSSLRQPRLPSRTRGRSSLPQQPIHHLPRAAHIHPSTFITLTHHARAHTYISPDVLRMMNDLLTALRHHPELEAHLTARALRDFEDLVRAAAALSGDETIVPAHVRIVLEGVVRHRLWGRGKREGVLGGLGRQLGPADRVGARAVNVAQCVREVIETI